jgi:drug/metabolite transporter (DMT)-like permease
VITGAGGPGAHPLRRALPLFVLAGFCLSSLLIVWARYAGQMLVVTPFAWHQAGPGFWRTRRLGLHLLRSSFLVAATMCFFGGLKWLPLAEGSAITFLAPIVVVLLAGPLLGERPTRARWAAAIAGFSGVLLLVRPGGAVFHPAALLLLGAAVTNGLYQLYTRLLAAEDPSTLLFYSALVGTVALTLPLPWLVDLSTLAPRDLGLLVLLGLLAGLGHWFMINAYQRAPASLLTPFTYLQMLWATAYGYLVFGQLPDGVSFVGMAVIVASGVGLALHERRRHVRI